MQVVQDLKKLVPIVFHCSLQVRGEQAFKELSSRRKTSPIVLQQLFPLISVESLRQDPAGPSGQIPHLSVPVLKLEITRQHLVIRDMNLQCF